MTQEHRGNVPKLFAIFKLAIEEERKAQAMYEEAVGLCEDELTRSVFEGLLDDEVRHERELVERYKRLRREHENE